MNFGFNVPASGYDDTPLFQEAINDARSDNAGLICLTGDEYIVGALDCTNLSGLRITGMINTKIDPKLMSTPAPVFNFAGSSNWGLEYLTIFCSGPHAVWPTYAIYAENQDKVVLNRVLTPGKWTQAALGLIGVHSVTLRDLQLSNFDSAAPALLVSSLPGRNTSDVLSENSEYHVGATNPYTIPDLFRFRRL